MADVDMEDLKIMEEGADDEPVVKTPIVEIPKRDKALPDDEEDIDEDKDEPEEEPEEVTEDIDTTSRHTVKDITKIYPEVFKKFPELRQAYFEVEQFRNVFSSVDAAKEAQEIIENYGQMESLITSGKDGDLGQFFKSVEEADPGSLSTIADNFLPTLQKLDENSYFRILTPILEQVVRNAYNSRDENTKNAALVLSNFLFNDMDIAKGTKTTVNKKATEVDPKIQQERAELDQERKALNVRKYTDFYEETINKGTLPQLIKEIEVGLDPRSTFSEGLKKILVKEVREEVDETLTKDKNHLDRMNRLWVKASQAGFSKEWQSKIQRAYLEAAKLIMPAIRTRIRAEALGHRVPTNREGTERKPVNNNNQEFRGRSDNNGKGKQIDYRKTSDMDIINGTEKYK